MISSPTIRTHTAVRDKTKIQKYALRFINVNESLMKDGKAVYVSYV
jgi:hypothetical protein